VLHPKIAPSVREKVGVGFENVIENGVIYGKNSSEVGKTIAPMVEPWLVHYSSE